MKIYANDNFSIIRMKKGMSMQNLADAVGITINALYKNENRVHSVRPGNAKKIIDCLGVEFDDVFEVVDKEGKK